jgi:hypothetical protein
MPPIKESSPMPDDGFRGLRLANASTFAFGLAGAMVTFLIMARQTGIDPFQMTGPEAIDQLSTGSAVLLFGSTIGAGVLGMVVGSHVGPALFGFGRWDRIDELDSAQLERIRQSGLDVECPACRTRNALVVPRDSPTPLAHTAVLCKGCKSAIRARVSGSLLAVGTFARKSAVRQAQERNR